MSPKRPWPEQRKRMGRTRSGPGGGPRLTPSQLWCPERGGCPLRSPIYAADPPDSVSPPGRWPRPALLCSRWTPLPGSRLGRVPPSGPQLGPCPCAPGPAVTPPRAAPCQGVLPSSRPTRCEFFILGRFSPPVTTSSAESVRSA